MPASAIGQAGKTWQQRLLTDWRQKIFSYAMLLGTLLAAGAFLAILSGMGKVSSKASAASHFWIQGDSWWHLAIGRQILATHSWPRVDVYSFTMHGTPWIAYEWLGDVFMALAWRAGGLRCLTLLLTVLACVVVLLLFYYSYLRCGKLTSAFAACAVLLPLASLSFALRPQLFGYVFLLLTFICLERFRQGHPKALWALPPIFLLWVNVHGTFAVGFAVLGIYLASGFLSFRVRGLYAERWTPAQRRQLGLTILLCGLALLVTPYGARLAAFPIEMKLSQPVILTFVSEWQPFPLTSPSGVLILALLLVFFVAVLTSQVMCQLPDFILLALAAVETFFHARFILLLVPVLAPFLAEIITPLVTRTRNRVSRTRVNALLMFCIGVAIVWYFPSTSTLQSAVRLTVPVDAASFIKSRSDSGRMFTYYDWGSYLMFDLGTGHRVFMDGRLDLYEEGGVLQDYLSALWTKQGLWTLLRKYSIHTCLVRKGGRLATLLDASPQWKEIYQDQISVIFVKREGPAGAAGSTSLVSSSHRPTSMIN